MRSRPLGVYGPAASEHSKCSARGERGCRGCAEEGLREDFLGERALP